MWPEWEPDCVFPYGAKLLGSRGHGTCARNAPHSHTFTLMCHKQQADTMHHLLCRVGHTACTAHLLPQP